MRILADENIPKPMVDQLRDGGHDVLWVKTDCPSSTDPGILDRAEMEERILLTLDKDFWQIAIQRKHPLRHTGVVLFRVHPATPHNLDPLVNMFLQAGPTWANHLSIISSGGIQMMPSRKR